MRGLFESEQAEVGAQLAIRLDADSFDPRAAHRTGFLSAAREHSAQATFFVEAHTPGQQFIALVRHGAAKRWRYLRFLMLVRPLSATRSLPHPYTGRRRRPHCLQQHGRTDHQRSRMCS